MLSVILYGIAFGGAISKRQTIPKRDRPNILFIINDDQSYLHASAYGAEFVNTPNVWNSYRRYGPMRWFPRPDWAEYSIKK